jgi:hypothetical protein
MYASVVVKMKEKKNIRVPAVVFWVLGDGEAIYTVIVVVVVVDSGVVFVMFVVVEWWWCGCW